MEETQVALLDQSDKLVQTHVICKVPLHFGGETDSAEKPNAFTSKPLSTCESL